MSRAKLEECASKLGLPDLILRRSRMVLQEWTDINICPSPDFQNDYLWSTCAIYTAVIECRTEMESPSEQGPVITLLQILKAAQVNVKSFLDCMNYIGKEYEHSRAMKDGLLGTKQKYCITIGIYRTFERLMDDIFQTAEERQTSPLKKDAVITSNSDLQKHRRRVCWCLFLVAKETMLHKNTELMPPLQLMLCCIHYIAKQSPLFMLKEPFRTAKSADVANGFANSCMLSAINVACARGTGINMDGLLSELLAAQASLFEPFLQNIPQGKLNQTADGLPELSYLERKYKAIYEKVADINEMAFLDNDPVLMPIREPRPRATSPDTTSSDVHQPVPQTPVRTSMRTVQSLKTVLANATDKPSASLVALLNEYGDNLVSVINQRVESLKEVFIKEYLAVRGQPSRVIAQTRFRLGVRLYHREMENFLKKERARQVESSSIKNLLSGDVFHKCLLACSLEVVKVTYEFLASPGQVSSINNGGLDFPWILSIFNLHAYDFCKVIETFIREETQLSEQAVKHLKNAEEFILESEAWKEGSPLFDALRARGFLTDSKNDVSEASSSSRVSNSQLWHSPGPSSRQQVSQSSIPTREATPPPKLSQSPPVVTRQIEHCPGSSVASSGNPQGRDVFLNAFRMKMQKLGYKRLKVMCAALEISGELENFMWTCLDHCIMERPVLLENCHLDQIIMCCIFAICKVNNRNILFKEIASVYSKMPHSVSSTYKHVKLADGTYGHIILFYNSVFITALKDFILRFQPHGQSPQISPVPNSSLSSTPTQQRPYRLTSNFIISPLKASPFKSPGRLSGSPAQMTPRTKLLIVTGEEWNSAKLQEFNRSFALEAKRKNEKEPSKFRKKLKLEPEDSSCEVGSTTEGSKQSTREELINKAGVTFKGDSAASGTLILRDRLAERPAGSPKEGWASDGEETEGGKSDGRKKEKQTSNRHEQNHNSSNGQKEDKEKMQ
ncbi:Retinoblastoma-associated protein [Holothuria leucospilota]|uniref:Retinoblastoma-associated protein n=1 Tax=Holothuria leucospilota TaxID=206669 RepID=A0A9Q1BR16_HOLLE|nr:Retinoblastoma-associated protein [Holothuria leucospilota]